MMLGLFVVAVFSGLGSGFQLRRSSLAHSPRCAEAAGGDQSELFAALRKRSAELDAGEDSISAQGRAASSRGLRKKSWETCFEAQAMAGWLVRVASRARVGERLGAAVRVPVNLTRRHVRAHVSRFSFSLEKETLFSDLLEARLS